LVLKSRQDIDRLLKTGIRKSGSFCTLVWEDSADFRYAVLLSGKFGTAAKRNRFKRLFREAVRLNRKFLTRPVNIALIVRPLKDEPEYKDIDREIAGAFELISHH
jgi:ribonuclease P protein component